MIDTFPDLEGKRPSWSCFSCGKFLGTQGDGGDFHLSFGYGSGYDMLEGLCGQICDECVTQKRDRLRVWSDGAYKTLGDVEPFASYPKFDTYGRVYVGTYEDSSGLEEEHYSSGFRDYRHLKAEERSRLEHLCLSGEGPQEMRTLAAKALSALNEAEITLAKGRLEVREELNRAFHEKRLAAKCLDPKEIEDTILLRADEEVSDAALTKANYYRLNKRLTWYMEFTESLLSAIHEHDEALGMAMYRKASQTEDIAEALDKAMEKNREAIREQREKRSERKATRKSNNS